MYRTQIITEYKVQQGVPFFNFFNGTWTETSSFNYNWYCYHSRGSGDQLSNFLSQLKLQYAKYILKYAKMYGIHFDGIKTLIKAYNDINKMATDFYNKFETMRDSVDNDVDDEGEPLYENGDCTCTFTFVSALVGYNSMMIKKDLKKNITRDINGITTTVNPDYSFELSNIKIISTKS